MTLKQARFELGLLISQVFLFQRFTATYNLEGTRATHQFLSIKERFIESKSGDKRFLGMFLGKSFATILLLMRVWVLIGHDNFSIIQEIHILRMRSVSHYVDISYFFLYPVFRPFMFINAIKTVTLLITYTHLQCFYICIQLRKNTELQA